MSKTRRKAKKSITLNELVDTKVKELADKECRSFSEMIERLVEESLKVREAPPL